MMDTEMLQLNLSAQPRLIEVAYQIFHQILKIRIITIRTRIPRHSIIRTTIIRPSIQASHHIHHRERAFNSPHLEQCHHLLYQHTPRINLPHMNNINNNKPTTSNINISIMLINLRTKHNTRIHGLHHCYRLVGNLSITEKSRCHFLPYIATSCETSTVFINFEHSRWMYELIWSRHVEISRETSWPYLVLSCNWSVLHIPTKA